MTGLKFVQENAKRLPLKTDTATKRLPLRENNCTFFRIFLLSVVKISLREVVAEKKPIVRIGLKIKSWYALFN